MAAFFRLVTTFLTFGGLFKICTGRCLRYTILESKVSLIFFAFSFSSSSTSKTNCRMKLSRTFGRDNNINNRINPVFPIEIAKNKKKQLLQTLGRLKSDGTLCKQVICGLSGNFSNIRKRKGKVSLISALCSRNLSCLSFLMSSSSSRLSRITATKRLNTIYRQRRNQ